MRRLAPLFLVALALAPGASRAGAIDPCTPRLLVLSAFPGEIDGLLSETTSDGFVDVDGRRFFVGTLRGNDVVLALSGIGLVNAEHTTRTALGHFACGSETAITGAVFSGVSGGVVSIGDVVVPEIWTEDGETWYPVDPAMYATAEVAAGAAVLARRVPLGDPACVGIDPSRPKTFRMPHRPSVFFGGEGRSADPFGGRAFPCIPGGGDVFGCHPCRAPIQADAVRFLEGARPFVDPEFFTSYFESPPPSTTPHDAEDMETAAVARVMSEHGLPFIAFRALSDGKGDPLRLPGFPFQFFVYRQLAADNAASVTLAFLEAWASS